MRPFMLRIGKNAVARLSAHGGARLLSLALVALVARYEGTTSLGRYTLVLTITGISSALADLGLNTFLTRKAARDTGRERQQELLGMVLPLKMSLAAVGYVLLAAIALLAPFPPATKKLLLLGGLSLLPEAATGAIGALINARQRMEITALLTLIVRLLALAGAWPVLAQSHGVAGVLACTIGAGLLGIVLHSAALWRWQLFPRYGGGLAAWRACLLEAYPFALTAIIALVYARLDLILLSLWQGDVVTGWYSAAYKLWEAIGLIPASLLDALFPEMSRLAGCPEGKQRLHTLFCTGGWTMVAVGLLLAAGGAWSANTLVSLVYGQGKSYAPAVPAFRLLVWAIPAMFLYLMSGHVLYAIGEQRQVTRAMLAVAVLNVSSNLIAIPRWSYLGAGAVALLSEWLLWGLLFPRARRALAAGESQ